MKLKAILLAGLLLGAAGATAQPAACTKSTDLKALLECSHGAMMVLPQDKHAELAGDFIAAAGAIGGEAYARDWAARLDATAQDDPAEAYPDFGWQAASTLLGEGGSARLIAAARAKEGPLRYGRAEALLAAGLRAAGEKQDGPLARALYHETGLAERLNEELLVLARSAGEFEQGDLAHAAALLATHRCDARRLDEALGMVMAPDAVRYAFWRARVSGKRTGLPLAIMQGATAEDTRHVRQTLDGLSLLAELGPCTG